VVGYRSLSKNVIQKDRVVIAVVIKEDMQLTDEQWSVVESLIPHPKPRKDRKGRPRVPARSVLDGMLWILWTGAPWKALPSEYPPYQTVHRRMQEWVEARVFWKVLKALAEDLRDRGKIDLTEAFIDGTHAGAKRGALSSELLAVATPLRSWQSQTLAVLRSPLGLRVVRAMKLSSSRKRLASASPAADCSA
jgi:transposase